MTRPEFTTDLHDEVLAKCNAKMVKVFFQNYEDLTADQFYIQVAKFGKTLSDDFQAVMKSVEKQDDIIVGFKPTKHDILEIYEEVYALNQRLNKIFGGMKVSVNMLRHAY